MSQIQRPALIFPTHRQACAAGTFRGIRAAAGDQCAGTELLAVQAVGIGGETADIQLHPLGLEEAQTFGNRRIQAQDGGLCGQVGNSR